MIMKLWMRVLLLSMCMAGGLTACSKSENSDPTLSGEMQTVQEKANQGDATAQIALANYYFLGNNGAEEKNPQKGIEWLQKAVDQNNAEAQYLMSELYLTPEEYGLKPDDEKAKKLLLKSAEQDFSIAQLAAGMRYKAGVNGFSKDLVQAKMWFEKAVSTGSDSAKYQLEHINE